MIRPVNKHTVEIDTRPINKHEVPHELARLMRGSYYFLGALLGRFNTARVSMPGGCNFGVRPIDQHLKGFTALGAEVMPMENGMIEVRTGQGKVALTGYMRAEDLRYGANALRAVPCVEGVVEMKKDAPVYAACDTGSEELRLIPKDEVVNVIGISDKWLQIERAEYDGDILRKGYVNDLSDENEYAGGLIRRSDVRVKEAKRVERWIYLPTEDELTHEQAYEKALDLLTTTDEGRAYLKTRMSEEHRTREALEKLNADIRLSIFGDGNYDGICWIVSIENIQNVDENVIVLMMPQGEWLEFTHGNG